MIVLGSLSAQTNLSPLSAATAQTFGSYSRGLDAVNWNPASLAYKYRIKIKTELQELPEPKAGYRIHILNTTSTVESDSLANQIRDFLFKLGILTKQKLPCKVISVGNISTGGTGKTPLIITLACFFQKKGISVGILSRGYGRKSSGCLLVTDGLSEPPSWELCGDEPTLMAKTLKGVPIVVDKKRFRGGSFLIEHFNPDIILLDDAFQLRLQVVQIQF